MGLLYEYAVTPDVFDSSLYVHEEVGTARLEILKEVFLEESIVRDLRNGDWLKVFSNQNRPWHRRGTELLKKLAKQNRLSSLKAVLTHSPTHDSEWCLEALASHRVKPLTGIISTTKVTNKIGDNDLLARIDRLGSSPCWTCRSTSVRLPRSYDAYATQLDLIMKSANSIMLIDPHLDPSQPRYSDVLQLLLLTRGRNVAPLIEIHRVTYVGSGASRQLIGAEKWENKFREAWQHDLSVANLKVKVFIWDDHHDRYLITDIIGIAMSNGYDTTTNQNDITTWSRLGRKERDDIQREFDPACNRHKLIHRFTVPYC